jgi:hypothetical protein
MKQFMPFCLALALLAGCTSSKPSESASKSAEPAKPAPAAAQLDTGRVALQRMAVPGHMWAADVQPVHLESQPTTTADGSDGKAGVWLSTWASQSRGSTKRFTWSGVNEDGAPSKGITPDGESSWSPSNTSMQAFNLAFLKIDSDKAYSTAKAKLPAKSKTATTPVKYALAFSSQKSQLVWRITFADGPTIDIDATTGNYVRTER